MKLRIMMFLLLAKFSMLARAEESTQHKYEPAGFIDGGRNIIEQMRFPKATDASNADVEVLILCEADVLYTGAITRIYCWSDTDNTDVYHLAIARAVKYQKIRPARVDGKRRGVLLQHSVLFTRKAGIETIKMFPHQFVGVEGADGNYSGPQRYENKSPGPRCWMRKPLWYSMLISKEGGKPTEITHTAGDNLDSCKEKLVHSISNGLYVPAFLNGEPVAARYQEAWLTN
jgi:hypothetical protein